MIAASADSCIYLRSMTVSVSFSSLCVYHVKGLGLYTLTGPVQYQPQGSPLISHAP